VIKADGALHRFSTNGKPDDDAGWYVHHDNGISSGAFGDWRTGVRQTWRADIGRPLTPAEEEKHRINVARMKQQREDEKILRRKEAQERANFILSQAQPCDEHPYFTAKHIKANGALIYKERIVIPLQIDGVVHSVQFISANGDKRFLMGGRVKGCYFIIGKLIGADVLCISESFSTGASIHAATDYPVVVTFNAGNLELVAKAMREKFPDMSLAICADDDYTTRGNPGLTAARQAARAVGGALVVPDFGPDRPESATDFNDMAARRGVESVRQTILKAVATQSGEGEGKEHQTDDDSQVAGDPSPVKSGVSQVAGVQTSKHAVCVTTPAGIAGVTGVSGASAASDSIPELNMRPTFRIYDNGLDAEQKFKSGVWYFDADKDGNLTHTWICSPLHINAVTFDGQHQNFGRLLRFRNTLGQWREWAMPMEMLRGAGDDLRGELLAMGVEISPGMKARRLLLAYLQAEPPERKMRCALQVGWCEGSFILPDTVIGPKASDVIFQSGECGHDEHITAGTLADWQNDISSRAVGNPLLLLALSAAFAGPMLALCNAEGGGLHFVGDSSTGKTTLLEAACSVWGGPNYRRSWRATANGMEGAAALFNDCLLGLDEISECNPNEVNAIIYALSNGRGKQRAGRSGNARAVTRWRCFVLSSGERSIETTLQEAGHKAKAGQAVRLLDLSAARVFGAWDNLHSLASGTAFSDAIKRAAATHHGHAGRAFLEKLTHDRRDFTAFFERFKALQEFTVKDGGGQEKRAVGRFALLALAGELATEYGITGWAEGDATKAAAEGFKVWGAMRGSGNDERRQILEQVSGFIERHGDSRFSKVDGDGEIAVRDRAGWWEDLNDSRIYLFTADGMQEALKSFDFKRALNVLQEEGVIGPSGADGKRAKPRTISKRPVRLYAVHASKLGAQHGA
jgi:putative DNA primase/helicase